MREEKHRSIAGASASTLTLWPFQRDDVKRLTVALARVRRVLYTLPTGGGKSTVAVAIILEYVAAGRPVLVLAHRRELIHQLAQRLLDAGLPEDSVGVLMADDPRRRPAALVQVASIDTFRLRRLHTPADLIVVDEAHRAVATSYRRVSAQYPEAKILGLTATPVRMSGRGLGDAFDHLEMGPSIDELILSGYLARPRTWTVPAESLPDLAGVRAERGDYVPGALGKAVTKSRIVGDIVEHWKLRAGNKQTVVFAVNVAHAKKIARTFRRADVVCEHLDGDTPVKKRDAILARLRSGETRVVTNCGVLTEGWDSPPVKCAVLARPTKSLGLYMQMVGRILRPWQGTTPIVLDHSGNAVMHGPPQRERSFSLDSEAVAGVEPQGRACPECHEVAEAGAAECAGCGYVWPPVVKAAPKEEAGELVEMQASAEERAAALERISEVAAKFGLGPEWISRAHAEMFAEVAHA